MPNEFKIKNGLLVDAGGAQVTGSLIAPNITGSLLGTASWALNAITASYFSGSISNAVTAETASFVTASNVYGPFGSNSVISSSYALTASFALNAGGAAAAFPYTGSAAISGALLVTGSVSATQGGFTGSLLGTASWAENAVTASYVQLAQSASYVLQAVSSSFASTASFVATASWAQNAVTASYITGSVFNSTNLALSASYALTASYVKQAESASFALTSSYAVNMVISGGLTNVDYIDFDTASAATMQDARLKWDDGEGTLQLGLKGNVDANIGEQLYQYVYNAEATTLTKATVVYVSGSQGGRIAVKRASATAEGVSAETLGLAAEDIAAGSEGWVITDGSLRGVNTSGLIGGRLIFLSSSAGEYTQEYPQAPLHGVRLGYVQKVDANPTQGILYIKIDNGYEIDELHDVRITSASTGELLVRSGSVWINSKQLTGSYGLTGSLTATTVNASFFTASGNAYPTNSGVSEYFLQTNGAGTLSWNYVRSVLESVKNVGATTLVKGTPVYVTSSVGNTAEVVKADAASSSLMPATYILNETLTAGQQGLGIVLGFINNIDTSLFNESDQVYVNAGGGYTNVQPTGSVLIQPLGTVVRVDSTNGSIMVSNTGVTNSLPNINPGYAWVGDSTWLPTAIATSSFFVNSASLALTASSGDAFTVRNFIELKPGTDPGTANVSSSYLFVTSSSDNTEFNLHYRNNGALWETHWLEERVDTGIVWGGVLTFNSTTMSITPGAGLIINHNASTASHGDTVATYVPFGPITASAQFITSSQVTYLLIDENGQLLQQTTKFTPEQYNEKFPLGYIFCLTTSSISSYADARITTYGQTEQGGEFIRAFGPLKISGYDISPQSGSLKISIASGQAYRYGGFYTQNPESPSLYDSTAVATGSLVRIYRDPAVTGGFRAATNGGFPFTDIDPTKWDDGSGTLQTVSASQWSIQRIFQGVVNGVSYVYYGQNVYDSLALALQSITTDEFVESPTSILALPFIGYVIAKGDTGNLADTTNNRLIQAGLFRNTAGSSGGGGAAAQSLDDLSDVTITGAANGQALVYNSGLWVNGIPTTSSYAYTASYVQEAVSASFSSTASYVLQAVSSSFASTASYVLQAVSSSFASTASYVLQAVSSSFAATASYVTGSVFNSSNPALSASYALTASYALNTGAASTFPYTGSAIISGSLTIIESGSIGLVVTGSVATGQLNKITGQFAHAEGYNNEASGSWSHAEGSGNISEGEYSHAEGLGSRAIGPYSHAEGASSYAYGESSHAEGSGYSYGLYSHAEGANTEARGEYSHAEGDSTVAFGNRSHTEGRSTYAFGQYSHAEGRNTSASADYSHAEGYFTVASGLYQHVQGQFNQSSSAQSAFIIGNGTSDSTRSNLVFASGSQFQVTGSVISTAGFTGSLQGTASWAQNAVTASYILNAVSSSFASTASYVLNAVSASYAATASSADNFFVRQDITASNALFTGTITAQRLNVQYITASTEFVTGSSKFGSVSTDTHQFTGSVSISGSFAVTGPATINNLTASVFGTSSWSQNAVTASYVQNAQTASYILNAVSSSFASTASYVLNAVSSSFASTASFVTLAQTASFVATASWANNAVTASYVTGSIFNSTNPALSASYALTASYALNAGASTAITVADEGTAQGTATFLDFTGAGVSVSVSSNTASINIPGGSGTTFPYTGSAIISGSLTIIESGSVGLTVTGSVISTRGFTGSLLGTSSWSENAVTASYVLNAVSASFASTASYVLNAVSSSLASTASYVLNAVSSSFASTASYVLEAVSSSFASTASFVTLAQTASFVATASWANNAVTASYTLNAVSSSYPISVTGSTIYSTGPVAGPNFTTNNSIFFGSASGYQATNAFYSNFLGLEAGYGASSAYQSNFLGHQAGYSASNAVRSNFLGSFPGFQATNAQYSNFFGNGAGYQATNAEYSNFFGQQAGYQATNANDSNFFGQFAGYAATSASYSNFFGRNAGGQASSASYSTLIGYFAGNALNSSTSIGRNNIVIGTNITLEAGRKDAINFGAIIFATGSYSTTSGNPFSGSVGNGRVGINIVNPVYNLDVSGSGNYTNGLVVTGSLNAPSITGSLFGTSSWAVSASWAPGGSSGLVTKAGSVANTSFAGNPRKATVTFGTAFANTSYAIVITGEDSRTWTIESKVAGSFVINANSNVGLAGTTYWIATAYGETA